VTDAISGTKTEGIVINNYSKAFGEDFTVNFLDKKCSLKYPLVPIILRYGYTVMHGV
jgi:hypothetical protein